MAPTVSKTALERDAVALDPKHYKVELENDSVRVVRVTYEGGEKSVMHQHPPGVGVFITGGKFKFTYPDGNSENIEATPGQFMWFGEQWEHLPEMLGDGHFEVVYVELK
jgi:quercetin dioxygenase-like cupin family protein